MALNPKLNIYVLSLKPKDKDTNPTFKDLFKLKYILNTDVDDNAIMARFFQNFLNTVGTTNFRRDDRFKKVIGVSEYNEDNQQNSLHLLAERNLIEGIIDGGQYGMVRALADINDKDNKTNLGINQAVLDKFYICLCTPLNSMNGFLFIQSYTEASIQEPIKSLITEVLKCEEMFYNVEITPFVPNSFVQRFNRTAKLRMFKYQSRVGLSNIMRNGRLLVREQTFEVEIKVKPLEDSFFPGTDQMRALYETFSSKIFDGNTLGDSENKKIYVEDDNKRKANYDISKELEAIRPTIYLQDEGIEIDEETGQPNFVQIKDFTLNLLEQVKSEYYSHDEIEEL